jgi:hypothetical protein
MHEQLQLYPLELGHIDNSTSRMCFLKGIVVLSLAYIDYHYLIIYYLINTY